jgi:hypothetical protein
MLDAVSRAYQGRHCICGKFFVEVAAKDDKQEALRRSGLTYLLRLKAFHDERSS